MGSFDKAPSGAWVANASRGGAGPVPALPRIGDVVIGGKFRIEEVLGGGGTGVVMGAEHVTLGRKVALKFLAPGDGAEAARFLREARAAARIDSEYVARASDVGVLESGAAYMVMERLYGEDAGAYVRRSGPLPVGEAVHYALQACDAIAAAHAAGVVHRDLKPSNLFLAGRADGTRTVKVLDFGLSKAVGSAFAAEPRLTCSGVLLGSPLYMSPEQVLAPERVGAPADVWGLGLVLYEMLTGTPAYGVAPLPVLCSAIAYEPPPSLRAARPDAPGALEAVWSRCAQKEPARRFGSAVELALALAPFAPPEAAPLVARIARRGGAAVASGGGGDAAAALVTTGSADRGACGGRASGRFEPTGDLPSFELREASVAAPAAPLDPGAAEGGGRAGVRPALAVATVLAFAGAAALSFVAGRHLLGPGEFGAVRAVAAIASTASSARVVSIDDLPLERPRPPPAGPSAAPERPAGGAGPASTSAAARAGDVGSHGALGAASSGDGRGGATGDVRGASSAAVAAPPSHARRPAARDPLDDLNHAAVVNRR
jgi:serine/threonine-protein kinase